MTASPAQGAFWGRRGSGGWENLVSNGFSSLQGHIEARV